MNAARLAPRHGRACLVLASAVLVGACSAAASTAEPVAQVGASPAVTTPVAPSVAPGDAPSNTPVQAPPLATVPPSASPTNEPSVPAGRPSDVPIQTPRLVIVPPTSQPIIGEAPAELIAAARADLAGRVTAAAAAVAAVIRSEAVLWPDGSLGCPELDTTYLPLETAGYWIVLRVDGQDYDYRLAERGAPRLCERLLPTNPGG